MIQQQRNLDGQYFSLQKQATCETFEDSASQNTMDTASCSMNNLPLQNLVLSSQSLDSMVNFPGVRSSEKRLSLPQQNQNVKYYQNNNIISEMNIDDSREISEKELKQICDENYDEEYMFEQQIMDWFDNQNIRQCEPDPRGTYFDKKKSRLSMEYRYSMNSSKKQQYADIHILSDSSSEEDNNLNISIDNNIQCENNNNSLQLPDLNSLKKQQSSIQIQQQKSEEGSPKGGFSLNNSSLMRRRRQTMNVQ